MHQRSAFVSSRSLVVRSSLFPRLRNFIGALRSRRMLSKCRLALQSGRRIRVESPTIRTITTKQVIDRESKYAAHNYHPIPAALCKGEGKYIYIHV